MAFPDLDVLTNHIYEWAILADELPLSNGAEISTQLIDKKTGSQASAIQNGTPEYASNVYNGHAGVRVVRADNEMLYWPLTYFDDGLFIWAVVTSSGAGSVQMSPLSLHENANPNTSKVLILRRTVSNNLYGIRNTATPAATVLANASTPVEDTLEIYAVRFRNGSQDHFYKSGGSYGNQEGDATSAASLDNFDRIVIGGDAGDSAGAFGGFVLMAAAYHSNTDTNDAEVAALMQAIEDYFNSPFTPVFNTGIRYYPVISGDVLSIASVFQRGDPSDLTALDVLMYRHDNAKNALGSALNVLTWTDSEDASRKQSNVKVGIGLTAAQKTALRYVSFQIPWVVPSGETCGLDYLYGWKNAPDFGLTAIVTLDGTNADLSWETVIASQVKYIANTTGYVSSATVEASGTFTTTLEQTSDTEEDVLTGLSSSQVVYVTCVPYDEDGKRSGGRYLVPTVTVP